MTGLKAYRGTIYEGPTRISGNSENQVFVKVALKSQYGVSAVKGEPNLYGGVWLDLDGNRNHGFWIPLSFKSPLDPNLSGWPRLGAEVIVYEDKTTRTLWCEANSIELPSSNYNSLDKIGTVIITIGS